jgi:hypothetical protein
LDGIDMLNVIEVWKIRQIGGLSCKKNFVALIDDKTHICICIETITKGVICHHFWRVMLYSNTAAKFYISIIPIKWYKDDVLMKLDDILKDSPILSAIKPPTNDTAIPYEINFTLQSLKHIQGSEYKENVQ